MIFLEVTVRDASEFAAPVRVSAEEIGGFRVLRAEGTAVPNTIAAVLLAIRDRMRKPSHAYFGWAEGNPLKYLARFIFFREGDIAQPPGRFCERPSRLRTNGRSSTSVRRQESLGRQTD